VNIAPLYKGVPNYEKEEQEHEEDRMQNKNDVDESVNRVAAHAKRVERWSIFQSTTNP
jgi:hypothetical protein